MLSREPDFLICSCRSEPIFLRRNVFFQVSAVLSLENGTAVPKALIFLPISCDTRYQGMCLSFLWYLREFFFFFPFFLFRFVQLLLIVLVRYVSVSCFFSLHRMCMSCLSYPDDMALHCLLCLLWHLASLSVAYFCDHLTTAEVASLFQVRIEESARTHHVYILRSNVYLHGIQQ